MEALEGPNGVIKDDQGMLKVVVGFYKDLFKKENRGNISLGENFWSEIDKITQEENDILSAPFTKNEIKEAIFSCYVEGSLGPDALPFFLSKVLGHCEGRYSRYVPRLLQWKSRSV